MLTLKCRDAGFDCEHVIAGENEQEIMNDVTVHATKVHGLTSDDMNSQMIEKIKRLIKTT